MDREHDMKPLRTHPNISRMVRHPATFQIKDSFLDLPKRVVVIGTDDIVNLQILLATTNSVDEFLRRI